MELNKLAIEDVSDEVTADSIQELSELQLASVGGGSGDVVFH
jgi:hypothetical protein